MSPWFGIAAVACSLPLSMAALSALVRRGALASEAARKAMHVEMGFVTAAFPWMFAEAWPVVAVSGIAVAWFATVCALEPLRSRFGPVFDEPHRRSGGQFWFACGVCAAFLATESATLYCAAILVMGLADSAAALAGRRWGRARETIGGARKSIAGSVAFAGVAFLVALAVPWMLEERSLASLVIAALIVALAATFVEASLSRGLDNFFIPLVVIAAFHVAASPFAPAAALILAGLAAGLFAGLRRRSPCPG